MYKNEIILNGDMMRVITGSARGRRLAAPEGRDVRPTADKVKEALFSIIQFEIQGRRVLDMFAGSGQLGIEALSRGAERAVFIDSNKKAVEIIKKNIEITGFKDKSTLINGNAVLEIKNTDEIFDIIFLDPPYNQGLLQTVLPVAAKKTAAGGIVICESAEKEELPEKVGKLVLTRIYKYGKTWIWIYRQGVEDFV